jgi:glycosyltransferase involved in cell wall biosynthesis
VLDEASVQLFSAQGLTGIADKAEFVLACADRINVRNICFWNLSPELKVLLAKILSVRDIRLIDVSPGPMLFDEMAQTAVFQRRVSLSEVQYFDRLDSFVSKYRGGEPPKALCRDRRKIRVIPNGVPTPPIFVPLPSAEVLLPRHLERSLAIGTCCRLVRDKRVEFLLDAFEIVIKRSPGSSLTIVGGTDEQNAGYLDELLSRVRDCEGLQNVFFVGEREDVHSFLDQVSIFAMASDRQGCPNASLEAMAMGLPVVSNRSGGMREQVRDGVNGYLVTTPKQMAERILALQKNGRLRRQFGRAARRIALEEFSMRKMRDAYYALLSRP